MKVLIVYYSTYAMFTVWLPFLKASSAKACNGVFGCALERSSLCNWE
jgi:hypothetical protein